MSDCLHKNNERTANGERSRWCPECGAILRGPSWSGGWVLPTLQGATLERFTFDGPLGPGGGKTVIVQEPQGATRQVTAGGDPGVVIRDDMDPPFSMLIERADLTRERFNPEYVVSTEEPQGAPTETAQHERDVTEGAKSWELAGYAEQLRGAPQNPEGELHCHGCEDDMCPGCCDCEEA